MLGFLSSLLTLVVFLAIGLIVVAFATYNGLQGLAQAVRMAHSNIFVSMKKRIDLINKLQEVASAYAEHEKMTQITVTEMENSLGRVARASQEADRALSMVMATARNYPELKANETYQRLMGQIEAVEADLQKARETYNRAVNVYNTKRASVPTVFFASMIGFQPASYFSVENADQLDNVQAFASEDGELLKATLQKAGYQMLEGTKQLGKVLGEKGRKVLEKSQIPSETPKELPLETKDTVSPTQDQPDRDV